MNIGVLGTGTVGEAIASALTEKGYNVRMGSRTENNEKAAAWVQRSNNHATQGNFNDAAAFGEIIFLCPERRPCTGCYKYHRAGKPAGKNYNRRYQPA